MKIKVKDFLKLFQDIGHYIEIYDSETKREIYYLNKACNPACPSKPLRNEYLNKLDVVGFSIRRWDWLEVDVSHTSVKRIANEIKKQNKKYAIQLKKGKKYDSDWGTITKFFI